MLNWTLTSEQASSFSLVRVEYSKADKFNHFLNWNIMENQEGTTGTTQMLVNFHSLQPALYKVRVVVYTNVNGTFWLHEVHRSFLQVSKGKEETKTTPLHSVNDINEGRGLSAFRFLQKDWCDHLLRFLWAVSIPFFLWYGRRESPL